MKRIDTTDFLAFILMGFLLLEIDFSNMSLTNWIALVVSGLWFILFLIKLSIAEKE